MAQWRVRGYVPDSDEEDESQGSDQHAAVAAEEGFQDIDCLDKGPGDPQEKRTKKNAYQRRGRLGSKKEKEEDEESSTQNQGAEKGHAGVAATADKHSQDLRQITNNKEPFYVDRLSRDVEYIDELQLGHYQDIPAVQLDAELKRDIYLLNEEPNQGTPSKSAKEALRSLTSSPLTELFQCSPANLPVVAHWMSPLRDRGSPVDVQSPWPLKSQDPSTISRRDLNLDPSLHNKNAELNLGRRNLRHRNPIQLHPYAIESEKYRQILKARGVKPLRIAQMEADLANATKRGIQEQDFDIAEDSQLICQDVDSQDPLSSSSQPGHTARVSPVQDLSDIFRFQGDELPDMDLLLRQPFSHVVHQGNKRRKTAHTCSKKEERRSIQLDVSLPIPSHMNVADDDSMFDVPPSPPHSGSPTPTAITKPKKDVFRVPRGLSPVALPTPVTSSEPRKNQPVELLDDSDTDEDPGVLSVNGDSSEDSEPESTSSGNEENSQLKRVQRKIKGVLPASWLKLDLKANTKKPDSVARTYRSLSPITSDQRGVARPVSGSNSQSLDTPAGQRFPVNLSDDEESDLEHASPESATNKKQRLLPSPTFAIQDDLDDQHLLTTNWGEVVEDNRVDAMLPSRIRSVIRPRIRRMKGQTTFKNLVEQASRAVANQLPESARSKPTHQPRITDRFDQRRREKPKFRPPRLSILDAPTRTQLSKQATPQFLKVASRTARARVDWGRHSPSRKFLRLVTTDDSKDANETLQCWREGTIVRTPKLPAEVHAMPLSREPLYPRSHNPQLPHIQPVNNDVGKEDLHSSDKARPGGNKSNLKKPRMFQRSLDGLFNGGTVPQVQLSYNRQQKKPIKVKLKVKKRGQLLSSLRTSYDSRPALLESLQEEEDQVRRGSAFKRGLSRIDQTRNQAAEPNMLVRRFFEENQRPSLVAVSVGSCPHDFHNVSCTGAEDCVKILPRPRKQRQPHRIDVEALNIKETVAALPIDDDLDHLIPTCTDDPQQQVLIGLGSFGSRYVDTFDVHHLSEGTCFHESTFIGSGDFLKSLNMTRTSDLDKPRGFMSLSFAKKTFRWGPWNDEVSEQLGQVFYATFQELRLASAYTKEFSNGATYEQFILLQRNIIRYNSNHLSFLDPVDRDSYLQRWNGLVSLVFSEMDECVPAGGPSQSFTNYGRSKDPRIRLGTLLLVIVNQLRQISEHELVPQTLKDGINSLVLTAARRNLTQALEEGTGAFKECLEDLRPLEASAYTIRENHHPIEALVIGQHIIKESTHSMAAFWEIVNKQIMVQSSGLAMDARIFEEQWQKLYNLLPFLEFDAQGILEIRQRFQDSLDNWAPIKRMISQVLAIYTFNESVQPPSLNAYCRALFSRCLHLINGWGWRRCESIIGSLFDFFARNNLAHLRNEGSHGSPIFLEHLDQEPSLEMSINDRCFHILLKIIGSGLKRMRQIYPEKKIRDIVWRLMPNHGRSHPKEKAIRQEDLDALRNHHDLLCTLYWAAPLGIRPRLSVIRNLVHLESSHREACHISIRAWSNLVRFQISTKEPTSSLKPFADWHDDLLGQVLRQHSLARTEAEEQVTSAQRSGGPAIPKDLLESTVRKNQRQVEAILGDALVSLKRAVDGARTRGAAQALLTPTLTQVFLLFDARRPQANRSIVEALDVLLAHVGRYSKSDEDSQDYGDWSVYNDDSLSLFDNDVGSSQHQTTMPLQDIVHEPLRHLLSNCFGADTIPNDTLLSKLVEVWAEVARCLIRHGTKSWSDYVGRFGHDSWTSLRDTEQTRKFTSYFLAVLTETDEKVYEENKTFFVISWIASLVEQESMLKFQHRLTSALLNRDTNNPLLENLPFHASRNTDRFEISATEFAQRRLSLISSILSNMRESVEDALCTSSIDAAMLKQEYKEILKHLMLTMKQRYQELGHGPDVRGAYVDFVHRVVEFLQQHTSAICPVDRFFLDSATFPLPAKDPNYVVGQLKNYGLRLRDSRTPKQLAVFLQSVSERAMVDEQQEYLVGQLHAALAHAFESGDARKPTLRAFVVKAIVPAYIEVAFTNASGWLLASPMLQALQRVFSDLLTDLDGTNPASVTTVLSTITVFLDCLRSSFNLLVDHSGLLDQPKVLRTLLLSYSAITATMPVLDYITRLSSPSDHAVACIGFFASFATFVTEMLLDCSDVLAPETDHSDPIPPPPEYADVHNFALQELRGTLTKNWICRDEQYHVIRGSSRKEVIVGIGSYAEEKERLTVEIERFQQCLGLMPALKSDSEEETINRRFGGISLADILLS
jgi:hypothetical protein